MSDQLAKTILDAGGEIKTGNLATQIATSATPVTGWNTTAAKAHAEAVCYRRTNILDEKKVAFSDTIITNANLKTLSNLFTEDTRQVPAVSEELKKLDSITVGKSCFCIFFAFKNKLPNLPNGNPAPYTTWFMGKATNLRELSESFDFFFPYQFI